MRNSLTALALSGLILYGGLARFAWADEYSATSAAADMSGDRAWRIVEILTIPELKGRGTGSAEFEDAARFAAERLQSYKYQPLGQSSYMRDSIAEVTVFRALSSGLAWEKGRTTVTSVVGWIPGTTKETIIIGAHLDHLGYDLMSPEVYYPGADDNASGVAAVLEIARAFSKLQENGVVLRRNIVIAFWGGEEPGLLGSGAFTESLINDEFPFTLNDIALVINMDMVGRRFEGDDPAPGGKKSVMVINSQKAKSKDQFMQVNPIVAEFLFEAATADPLLEFKFDDGGRQYFRRTDSFSFVKERWDISTLFFCGPEHPDYHKPTDTAEKLDYDRLVRIARVAFLTAFRVAQSEGFPRCHTCYSPN